MNNSFVFSIRDVHWNAVICWSFASICIWQVEFKVDIGQFSFTGAPISVCVTQLSKDNTVVAIRICKKFEKLNVIFAHDQLPKRSFEPELNGLRSVTLLKSTLFAHLHQILIEKIAKQQPVNTSIKRITLEWIIFHLLHAITFTETLLLFLFFFSSSSYRVIYK